MMERQAMASMSRQPRERGFSLIELMISMVIGMVVVGAVFAAYLGMGTSSRTNRAMAQMTEDVSLAMNILRSHIAMAGYSTPLGIGPNGKFTKNYMGGAINGCQSDFTDLGASIDGLTCTGTGEDAIAVAYEADEFNAVQSAGNLPLDCLGNEVPLTAGVRLSYSRFYVSNGQLFCRGPGSNTPAALVENIADMKVWYGVATTAGGAGANQAAYYSRVGNPPVLNATDFGNVVSARVCLVVSSENEILDNVADYVDCEGNPTTPADRKLYRAFTSTIVLQNRTGIL
jgi:type IV pilus assembly protein PilW